MQVAQDAPDLRRAASEQRDVSHHYGGKEHCQTGGHKLMPWAQLVMLLISLANLLLAFVCHRDLRFGADAHLAGTNACSSNKFQDWKGRKHQR